MMGQGKQQDFHPDRLIDELNMCREKGMKPNDNRLVQRESVSKRPTIVTTTFQRFEVLWVCVICKF